MPVAGQPMYMATRTNPPHTAPRGPVADTDGDPAAARTAAERKTVWWEDEVVCLLDQTRLPFAVEVVRCSTLDAIAHAIRAMQVRGAPAIGVTAAYGLALVAQRHPALCVSDLLAVLDQAAATLRATR